VLVNQMATLFCRLVAAIGRDMAMAATLGTFSLGMLLVAVSKGIIKTNISMFMFSYILFL
jgi:hypothetical protein